MDLTTASEARQWRRCSLAAVVVLVLSLAGEQAVVALSPDDHGRRQPAWSVSYVPRTALFRLIEHFTGFSVR